MTESQNEPKQEQPMFLQVMHEFNALQPSDYIAPTENFDLAGATVLGPAPDWLKRLWTLQERHHAVAKDCEEKLKAVDKQQDPEEWLRLETLRVHHGSIYNYQSQLMTGEVAFVYREKLPQPLIGGGFLVTPDWTLAFRPMVPGIAVLISGGLPQAKPPGKLN